MRQSSDPFEPPPSFVGPSEEAPPPPRFGPFESAVEGGPVVEAAAPAPPITGGTLAITRDGRFVVAADPARDRVSIVSMVERRLTATVELEAADEPGRVVEGPAGQIFVALRRGGSVVAIGVEDGEIQWRKAVCGAPRGMGYDADASALHVACAGGQLVTLAVETGAVQRTLRLETDLRDVIVRPEGLLISRFKSAELLAVSKGGDIEHRTHLAGIVRNATRFKFDPMTGEGFEERVSDPLEPAVMWRTAPAPDGSVHLLHQFAFAGAVELEPDPSGADAGVIPVDPEAGGAYGAPSGTCGGIVQAAVSSVGAEGQPSTRQPFLGPALAVDMAVSPDSAWLAVAHAGVPGEGGQITLLSAHQPVVDEESSGTCVRPDGQLRVEGQTTAVAFNPDMTRPADDQGIWFAIQTREPAEVVLYRDLVGTVIATIPLGGPSVRSTGHDLFHRDTGSGIACASCHVEGTEDGRVWHFEPLGPRRTQAVNVGLEGMAPFHWDGDMSDFDMLFNEVFVRRMGGASQTPERIDALARWLFSLRPLAPMREADADDVLRGKALFESREVGCATCHAGAVLSNNLSVHVGTTEPGHLLQVPSLVGIGYRAPFLHDGCAANLTDRFDPNCGGGDAHGTTSGLGEAEIGDLVAYLESL